MTFDERRLLKQVVSEARRARDREMSERRGERSCEYCQETFVISRPHQRFCSSQHKAYGWASHTPQGRAWKAAKQSRQRAAKRAAA